MIPRSLAQRALRFAPISSTRRLTTQVNRQITRSPHSRLQLHTRLPTSYHSLRAYATSETSSSPQNTPAGDEAVEEITELYATAYDEFEIATESTEANATYAEEDRKAAREELENVLEAYKKVGEGDATVAEEVRRRVGQRIRELEQGVKAMEERAMEQD